MQTSGVKAPDLSSNEQNLSDIAGPVLGTFHTEKRVQKTVDGQPVITWQPRVMAVLEDCICFALSEQGKIRDTVMYCDIEQVEEQDGEDTIGTGTARAFSKKRGARGPVTMRHEHERSREGTSFRIFDGSHHRNYFFRMETPDERTSTLQVIRAAMAEAQRKAILAANKHPVERARLKCATILESQLFQYTVGFILVFNFLINVAEAELANIPDIDDNVFEALDTLDITLTVFYCVELAINLFVHWWRDFVTNGWSVFDALCVILSVVGNLLAAGGSGGGGLSVLRSIRIFKIVRIFSRFQGLQRVLVSIGVTLFPLFNTFVIYIIVNSICAVLAAQFFGEINNELFGSFFKTWLTMVQISTGDGWMTDVLRPLMDQGADTSNNFRWMTAAGFTIYVMLVQIVLMNVAVAVLLEGFLSAMAEHEESDRMKESHEEYTKISKSLDPLISTFTTFHSEEQLVYMIDRMYEYLDIDASGSISFEEMKSGLEKLPMEPALRFTHEDYEEFTRNLTYADENGDITKAGFLDCMLLEMKGYAFRNASHQMVQAQKHEREEAFDYLTSKVLLRELFQLSSKVSRENTKQGKEALAGKTATQPGSEMGAFSEEGLSQNGGQTPWWCKTIFDQLEKLQKQNVDIQSALRKLERHHVDIQNRFDQQENRSSPASSSGHWAAHEVNREELASRLFDSLDTSRFGMISKDDLIPALEAIDFKKDRAEEVFASIDEDGSNEISKDVFMDFFLSGHNEELFRKLRYATLKAKISKDVPVKKTSSQCLDGKSPNGPPVRQEKSGQKRGILQISLVCAENLPQPADRPVNLFVILSFGKQRKSSVVVKPKARSLSASWNENFLFHVFNDDAEPIVLTLCNWDSAGQHEVMGHVKISPSDISRKGPVTPEVHYLVHHNKKLLGQNSKASTLTVQIDIKPVQAEDEERNSDSLGSGRGSARESVIGSNPNTSYIKTAPRPRVITPRVLEDARSDDKHSEAQYVEAADSIFSVQSDLVFDFSSPEDKGAGFDSNPLVGGNVRRSAESTFSAGGVPSGEHSGRVEGRGQASNRADMNRESKNGTYEDFSSVGANSRKDLRRVSTMQDSPMQERRLKESENAGVARSTLSRQRSEEHRRTSLGHNVGALAIAPLSGREDTVMTLENTSQDELIMLRGRRMSRQEKVSGWLL